jgi:hypothetical protein
MLINVCCYGQCHSDAFEGFWASRDNIYNACVVTSAMVMFLRNFGPYVCLINIWYDRCHGNAVKGFGALSDSVCDYVL